MKIKEIIDETTSGGIAVVARPLGSMIKRPNPSIYTKNSKRSKQKKHAPS